MSIARHGHATSAPRLARLAGAGLLAALALALAAAPVLAAVHPAAPEDVTWTLPSLGVGSVAEPVTAAALASPAPSASAAPSPSPAPAASAAPSPSPSATPAPTPAWSKTITTVGTSIRFYGHGYGHGVGMSQWGARGRALAGQTAPQILSAYFRGTVPGVTTPTRAVRVLVLYRFAATATTPLTVHGRSGPWTIYGVAATFPADATLTAWRTSALVSGASVTTWHLKVVAADGLTVLYTGVPASSIVDLRPATTTSRLQLNSKPSTYDLYRGRLLLRLSTSSLNVVNQLALDDYLKGVVPVEMPASWPAEAVKAQAVVARSWTVRHLHPTTGSYDVYDDTRSQVYRGVRAENTGVNALLAAAPGAVLLYGTSVASTYYHSAAGGWTENNEDAFIGASGVISSSPVPYLRGVDDRTASGVAYDAAAPLYAWSTTSITHAQLNAILAADTRTAVGTVARLDLTHRGVSGRLYQVVIYGSTGTKTVSGDVFCAVYNAHRPAGTAALRSNLFSASPLP